jgi:two-component system response regulator TtrR
MSSDGKEVRRQISVAIVEDDASFRLGLHRLCEALGFSATSFESGPAFLDALDRGGAHPHCLLVDLLMPAMTGVELHDTLVARGVSIPTIMITGGDAPQSMAPGGSTVRTDRLQKPIGAEELLAAVMRITSNADERTDGD